MCRIGFTFMQNTKPSIFKRKEFQLKMNTFDLLTSVFVEKTDERCTDT